MTTVKVVVGMSGDGGPGGVRGVQDGPRHLRAPATQRGSHGMLELRTYRPEPLIIVLGMQLHVFL